MMPHDSFAHLHQERYAPPSQSHDNLSSIRHEVFGPHSMSGHYQQAIEQQLRHTMAQYENTALGHHGAHDFGIDYGAEQTGDTSQARHPRHHRRHGAHHESHHGGHHEGHHSGHHSSHHAHHSRHHESQSSSAEHSQGHRSGNHEFANGAYSDVKAPNKEVLAQSVHAVVDEARKLGLSPSATRAAVASMLVESRGNPHAIGDHGTSFGLFQLHRGGELTEAHLSPQQAFDPHTNAHVALSYFKRLDGRVHDPGQLAAAAQRPANRAEYAAKVDRYLGAADRLIQMYGS